MRVNLITGPGGIAVSTGMFWGLATNSFKRSAN
jgi:hypothetical protein